MKLNNQIKKYYLIAFRVISLVEVNFLRRPSSKDYVRPRFCHLISLADKAGFYDNFIKLTHDCELYLKPNWVIDTIGKLTRMKSSHPFLQFSIQLN